MGYFSNGAEGRIYQQENCQMCHHDRNHDCPVYLAHLVHNYEQIKYPAVANILGLLIPRAEDGSNKQCTMFTTRARTPATGQEGSK